jgi:hypothetical protein
MPRTAERILQGRLALHVPCAAHANVVYTFSLVFHVSQEIIFEADVTVSNSIKDRLKPRLMS